MYNEIHQLKTDGLKKSQVARKLGINVKTVNKYWKMDPDGFAQVLKQSRARLRKLDRHHDVILGWLRQFPDISAAQVMDWLIEHYRDDCIRERTVRRFVAELRKEHNITKKDPGRQYQAVADPPMGKQMQVDFGETTVRKSTGGFMKIYVMGALLSNSRYKYGQWSDKPLTTAKFVQMLSFCFDYMGGVPAELVFDQDRLLAVSENYGDVIYTYEFEKFRQAMGFKVRLCKANDPESKGRIEAFIKYMKYNFAANRLYIDIKLWNRDFEDWLDRTGNHKPHGTTKKVPAEVFLVEKQYLRPVPLAKTPVDIVTRIVRKDNTILYNSNRYSVPVGTYKPGLKLEIRIDNDILSLWDMLAEQLVAEHKIHPGKGVLVQNTHHLRDNNHRIKELLEKTLNLLGGTTDAATFLESIRREKGRYVREQYGLMIRLAQKYPPSILEQAISYCLINQLHSAVDCRDAAAHFLSQKDIPVKPSVLPKPDSLPDKLRVKAEQRSMTVYTRLMEVKADE